MSPETNLQTVKTIYDAFGRGNVAAILYTVTDDVDWAPDAASDSAPWCGQRIGKGAVSEFFTALAEAIDVVDFTSLSFAANDDEVMVLIRFATRSRASGKEATMHLHHYWRFREDKIEYYRGSEDTELTAATLAA